MNKFNFNKLIVASIMATFFGNMSTSFSAEVVNLSQTPARGGSNGGGGSVIPENPATSEQITALVKDLKIYYVPWVLFRFEAKAGNINSKNLDSERNIYSKLIINSKGETVYELLKTWNFDPKPTGPCKDLNGEDADASAFGDKPNDICFSVERLAPKLSRTGALPALIALAIHEISHRMDIGLSLDTHPDSIRLQEETEAKLPLLLNVKLGERVKTPFRGYFNALSKEIESIKTMVENNEDKALICEWLTLPKTYVDEMYQATLDASDIGIALGRPRVFWRTFELQMLVQYTQNYCKPRVTVGSQPMGMKYLMDSLKVWPEDASDEENILVKSPAYGDNKVLSALLSQILDITKKTRDELPPELFVGY